MDQAPLDEARVARLLRSCSDSLTLLRRERGVSWDRMADPLWLPGVTYLMVTAVGACLTAAQHVCGAEQWGAPGDDGSAMRVLGEHGVLTPATAEAMRQVVEFRAVLLSGSDEIDDEVVLARLADPSALERFVTEVDAWLAAVGRP